jgi:aminopeptidase N
VPGMNLTRAEAAARAALVSVDTYAVELDLTTSESTFRSRSTVSFRCSEEGAETFIDLVAPSVEEIRLNGVALDPATHFDGIRVRLPGLAQHNELLVAATGRYMNTGEGLHRFVDPADGEVYLYSDFQVANCRRMFPVFDQPDLKASFVFTVTAPTPWHVVSNSPTPEPEPAGPGSSTWRFKPTPRMSSYITALIAGPYDVVRDEAPSRSGLVPLAIYCRKSLSTYLDADNIFDITKRGLRFFEDEFDCAYPFEKYDQLFTPEYVMGAMENAGAVTINEQYIFRAKVTDYLVERRALTILHEIAHMWFGDLVTMKWWDDLWLNESFAEWAATTCQAEATQWSGAWTTFGTKEKAWAYRQDQLSTTHPIVAPIRDLADVELNFDGITYAKGASVLKQLVAYVGREDFADGLRAYFDTHAWGNTTLHDLLVQLETTSGRDLQEWSRAWLQTSGVTTLRPEVEVDGEGTVTAARIHQSPAHGGKTLPPHRLAVGLYTRHGDALVRTGRLELDIDGATTELPELLGARQPDLLLVNDDDLAYAKIRLDEPSLATVMAVPRGLADPMPRALVLGAVWDMTRDAEMRPRDYVRLALEAMAGEHNSALLLTTLAQVRTAVQLYVAPADRDDIRGETQRTLLELAQQADPGSDAQLQLVSAGAGLLTEGDDPAYLRAILDGTQTLPGLVVDTEVRWTLLTALAAAGAATEAEIRAERERDDTATGREREIRAFASIPTAEAKAAAWHRAVETEDLSNSMVEAAGLGFGRARVELLEPYVARFHDMLLDVASARTHVIGKAVVQNFFPMALASEGLRDASQAWLDSHPDAPYILTRLVAEHRDALTRALAAQARDARS